MARAVARHRVCAHPHRPPPAAVQCAGGATCARRRTGRRARGGSAMTFEAILDQAMAMLQRRRRVAYRTLQVQFNLDDGALEALKDELLYAQQVARDEDGRVLVWTGGAETPPSAQPAPQPDL